MMRRWMICGLVLIFLVSFWGSLRAEEPKKWVKIKSVIGYRSVGHDDELTKVSEYEGMRSSATADLNMDVRLGEAYFGGHWYYEDRDDKDTSAYLNIDRIFRSSYYYNSFIHRTGHDQLFHDKAKYTPPDGVPGLLLHDTHGVVSNLTAFVPLFYCTKTTGETGLHGAQMYAHTDMDRGRDYEIFRTEHKGDLKLQLPFFPYLIPEMKIRREVRRGWRQTTFMAGKCLPCHVVGNGLRVDERTTDVSIGATLKYGIVTASYFHTEGYFDNRARKNYYLFDDAYHPKYGTVFKSRLSYENERKRYGEVPDVDKDTDAVKLRVDLPYATTFYGSFVTSRVENEYTNNSYDMDAYFARLTSTLFANRLTLSGHFRYYDLDNDDVDVRMENIANNPTVLGPAYGVPVSLFSYERKSNMERGVTEAGLDFSWRFLKGYNLRGGYTFKEIDRKNYHWKKYFDPSMKDEGFLDHEITEIHDLKIALNARPFRTLTGRISYEFEYRDNPFENHNGICLRHRNDLVMGGTPYYEIFRNAYRHKDASNVPTDTHRVKLNATWAPSGKYSVNANFQYTYQKNNDSDWENNTYIAGINFWLSPINNLFITLGYNYERNEYETRFCYDFFAG